MLHSALVRKRLEKHRDHQRVTRQQHERVRGNAPVNASKRVNIRVVASRRACEEELAASSVERGD